MLLVLLPLFIGKGLLAKGIYQQPESFVEEVLGSVEVKSKIIWLNAKMQQNIIQIMGHKYPRLRLRYWQKEMATVWILEEIGKEEPITVGIHILQGKIQQLKVLVYRETRGDEVRHPFFTNQFSQAQLTAEKKLTQSIDGITGATLSVRALKKLSVLALWLAGKIEEQQLKSETQL